MNKALLAFVVSIFSLSSYAQNCSSQNDYDLAIKNGLKIAPPCKVVESKVSNLEIWSGTAWTQGTIQNESKCYALAEIYTRGGCDNCAWKSVVRDGHHSVLPERVDITEFERRYKESREKYFPWLWTYRENVQSCLSGFNLPEDRLQREEMFETVVGSQIFKNCVKDEMGDGIEYQFASSWNEAHDWAQNWLGMFGLEQPPRFEARSRAAADAQLMSCMSN